METLCCMKTFCRVVETGSFSAVARELGTTQPTVSKQIAFLEQHLGSRLLNRSHHKVSVTETGRGYYASCVHILNDVSEAESAVRQLQAVPTGKLRVNIPVAFGRMHVVPLLWDFMRLYPEIELELILNDRYVNLLEEGVDLAIRVGVLHDTRLVARKLGSTPQVTIAAPDYLKCHGVPQTPSDLQQHNCLLYTLLRTPNEWQFQGPAGLQRVRIGGSFSANNSEAVRDAVLQGFGIAVFPTWLLCEHLHDGSLQILLPDYPPNPLAIHALYPQSGYLPLKVRCFIDYLRAEFARSDRFDND